jgi:hypothetical protein
MNSQQITFFLTGLTAGLVTVAGARAWPMLLVHGVGPLFFVAVLAAITLTGSRSHLGGGWWRILVGICVSIGAYLLALFAFSVVAGYSPDLLGIRASGASSDLSRFGADVWLGLLAAALVASVGIELLVYVLTGKWSNSFLFRLAAAGLVSVLVTFLVDRAAHYYWTFYGVLLPMGEGLFCAVVGAQIRRTSEQLVR